MDVQKTNKVALVVNGLAFFTLMAVGIIFILAPPNRSESSSEIVEAQSGGEVVPRDHVGGDSLDGPPPPSGVHMDATERQLYTEDQSSAGYTESDRDFLEEHGVSEQEA